MIFSKEDKSVLVKIFKSYLNNFDIYDKEQIIELFKNIFVKIKKKYVQPMSADFLTDKSVDEKWYKGGDWHNLIIGTIERIYVREDA